MKDKEKRKDNEKRLAVWLSKKNKPKTEKK